MHYISGALAITVEPDADTKTIRADICADVLMAATVKGIDPEGKIGSEMAAEALDLAVRGKSAQGSMLGVEVARLAERNASGWVVSGPFEDVEPEPIVEPEPPKPEKKRRSSRRKEK